MPEIQDDTLLETLVEALETMAFVTLMPAEPDAPPPADARLVSIGFIGASTGVLRMVAPVALGHLLAANLLGIEPADPEAMARGEDALCELMNVACGALLRRQMGESIQPVEMSLPRLERFDAQREWEAFAIQPGVHLLDADGHTLAVQLCP